MTLVIALSDNQNEFWVASDTAGATESAGVKVRLPGVFTKVKVVRSGADVAITAVSGVSELNGKAVSEIISDTKDELFGAGGINRLYHKIKTAWRHDAKKWPSTQEKKAAHQSERLTVLVARTPERLDYINRIFVGGKEEFHPMTNQLFPFTMGEPTQEIANLIRAPNLSVSDWPGVLAKAFSLARNGLTVDFPVQVYRWKRTAEITLATYDTPAQLAQRSNPELSV